MQLHTEHDDLYRVLDVHPAASAHEIRLAYRKRVMIWHPDRNSRPDAAEKFKRVRSAAVDVRYPSIRSKSVVRPACPPESSRSPIKPG